MLYATEPAYAFDKVAGEGGAWITQTGAIYHIKEYARHGDCVVDLLRTERANHAYDLGWVRVSWDQHGADTFGKPFLAVNFEPTKVTVAALRQLRRIMRVIASTGAKFSSIDTDEYSNYKTLAKNYPAAYALISKLITEKLACQKKRISAAENANSGMKSRL